MKKADLIFILCFILFFLPFFIFDDVYQFYYDFNKQHGYIMSYIKFFMLAPVGEVIGLRIRTGHYGIRGFGIIPRAIVWGFLGISVKMAFDIFYAGAPVMMNKVWSGFPADIMKQGFSGLKLLGAFAISFTMNIFYAPVLMTVHKISDEHIMMNGGSLKRFFSPVKAEKIMGNINWKVMWNFVYKKTIPLFWIPMQTINFLLPEAYRILVDCIDCVKCCSVNRNCITA